MPKEKDSIFSIKPNICILADNEKSCTDTLKIKWQTSEKKSLCLYQRVSNKKIHCWQKNDKGRYELFIETNKSLYFDLYDMDNTKIFMSSIFEVINDQKKYRRKRRNPWSFF